MTTTALLEPGLLGELYTEHLAMLQDGYSTALEQAGLDAVVIYAGTAAQKCIFDDQYWAFKPTPAFAHWLPLAKPGAVLLIQPGKRPTLFFEHESSFWESEVAPESDHFWASFDEIEVQGGLERVKAELDARLPGGRIALISGEAQAGQILGVAAEARNPAAVLQALERIRTRKTGYERLCIAEANRRAALGHKAVLEAFIDGELSELELHLLYLQASGQDDAETPYKNIVAIDENAAVLHHVNYRRQRPRHRAGSLLIDAGATCMGYCSDITRTVIKGPYGQAVEIFGELIRRVEALQAEVIRRITPGMEYESLHDQAHELLAPILRDLGIARASDDELVAGGVTRCFLPHGLGHSLGIQVHDVGCRPREPRPDNRYLRNTSVIEPGQVFTIEPGCYFIPALLEPLRTQPIGSAIDWDLVNALAHYGGVRIEDNIAVLESGTSNLTRDNWPASP